LGDYGLGRWLRATRQSRTLGFGFAFFNFLSQGKPTRRQFKQKLTGIGAVG
jgi:hypothetical protein